jgi:uncharacterized protein (DUF58 family)
MAKLFSRFIKWVKWFITPPRTLKINPAGLYFIGFVFAVGIAAVNTGNNLLYIILGAMLSFIIASGVISNIDLKKLEIKREGIDTPFAKTPTLYRIDIKNKKRFFFSYLIHIYEKSLDGADAFIPVIKSSDSSFGVIRGVFPKRGLYNLGRIKVSTNFPFGLFSKGMNVDLNQEVLVLPKISEIDPDEYGLSGSVGETSLAHSGHGTEPWGVKEFLPGDNPKFIHWRSSAKRDDLMKKEFAKETERKVTIKLPPIGSMSDDDIEEKVEKAASLSAWFIREGYAVGLMIPGKYINPDRGEFQLYTILRELALFDARADFTSVSFNPESAGAVIDV